MTERTVFSCPLRVCINLPICEDISHNFIDLSLEQEIIRLFLSLVMQVIEFVCAKIVLIHSVVFTSHILMVRSLEQDIILLLLYSTSERTVPICP